ncbi:hypothetical protein GCM10008967_33690 [Bacillus carboniphilus]|uniref:L,D-TPase catalytic domain-containing protein n=1 Tax=Bacillus carboniphilus TaxID=86663 RepID=A0ABN0WKU1_9BACI
MDKKVKSSFEKKDIILLLSIFYILGIITATVGFFLLWPNDTVQEEPKKMYSELYVSDISIHRDQPQLAQEQSVQTTDTLWEVTTVLRSAIYHYTKKNGFMPNDLTALTQPFPHNIISSIPKEPHTLSNQVSQHFTNKGGWVYEPKKINNKQMKENQLKQLISEALYPNVNVEGVNDIHFEPLRILVLKNSNELYLVADKTILRKYTVALGHLGSTPEGIHTINQKIMNPNSHVTPLEESPYGKRALGISQIAIHGTNSPEKIGENVSNGCIRMLNEEIKELYSIVPLFTEVEISSDMDVQADLSDKTDIYLQNTEMIYNQADQTWETDNSKVYHWSG